MDPPVVATGHEVSSHDDSKTEAYVLRDELSPGYANNFWLYNDPADNDLSLINSIYITPIELKTDFVPGTRPAVGASFEGQEKLVTLVTDRFRSPFEYAVRQAFQGVEGDVFSPEVFLDFNPPVEDYHNFHQAYIEAITNALKEGYAGDVPEIIRASTGSYPERGLRMPEKIADNLYHSIECAKNQRFRTLDDESGEGGTLGDRVKRVARERNVA